MPDSHQRQVPRRGSPSSGVPCVNAARDRPSSLKRHATHATKPIIPQRAMGQRLLALACITSTTALECYVGRAHDADLRAHSSAFVDGVSLQTCPSDADACCVTFEAARCDPRVVTS